MNQTPPALDTVRNVADLRARVAGWRAAGASVGLVPTMGAIHDGHLALAAAARAECGRVAASLFVNPTQFGANEDLGDYPRREADDAAALGRAGVDLLFAPPVEEMYPDGFATTVTVSGLADGLCGPHRPGHFAGVATVVAKLLTQCLPDRAYFGEKDYQQLLVIRRMARDLDLPVEIRGVPIVREADGLALSSRNAYLSPAEREIAANLNRVIRSVAVAVAGGAPGPEEEARAAAALREAGFDAVDYVAVRDASTLAPIEHIEPGAAARVFAAAHVGQTRLIDNVPVQAEP
jgi:pantoate--beta-alanine ligase